MCIDMKTLHCCFQCVLITCFPCWHSLAASSSRSLEQLTNNQVGSPASIDARSIPPAHRARACSTGDTHAETLETGTPERDQNGHMALYRAETSPASGGKPAAVLEVLLRAELSGH